MNGLANPILIRQRSARIVNELDICSKEAEDFLLDLLTKEFENRF